MHNECRLPSVHRLAMAPNPAAGLVRSPEFVTARILRMRRAVTLQCIYVVFSSTVVCLHGEWCAIFTLRVVCHVHIQDFSNGYIHTPY